MRRLWIVLALMATIGLGAVAPPAVATVPGTDGRIAFSSQRFGGDHNIFTMNADGSDVHQLTFLTADQGASFSPAWSPDGSTLVFLRQPTDGSPSVIYMMNEDGTNQRILFSDPTFLDGFPSFSPDGKRVIFQRCRTDFEACAIYTVKTDGHGLTAITHFDVKHQVQDQKPEYSPDGSTIAFGSANRGGVTAAVYLMDAHGTNVRRITPTALEGFDPDWSPDGSRLAFRNACCALALQAIWTVRPDGTGLAQLSSPAAPDRDWSPSYSPEGDRIAFERKPADSPTARILTMNPDGSDVVTIQTDAFIPNWGASN